MRKHLAFVFIFWAGLSLGEAGEASFVLSGRVKEKSTRRPLAGVPVCVPEDGRLSAVTGDNGNFQILFSTPGSYTVSVKGGKAEPASFMIGPQNPMPRVTLYVEPGLFYLPDIVVTAERDKNKVSKRIISGEELRQVPGGLGDPLKAMQSLPGVAVGSDAQSSPAIRGSRPGDNLFYFDDLPAGYLYHMGDLLSVMNADLVKSFTVYPSAYGPQFGNVIGAVIDVKLREPRQDRFGMKLNVSAFETDVLVEGPLTRQQSFYLAGRRSYLDLLLSSFGDSDEVEVIQFPEFYDYQGKYIWQLNDRHTVACQMFGAWDKMALEIKENSDIAAQDPDLAGKFSHQDSYDTQAFQWTWDIFPGAVNRMSMSYLSRALKVQAARLGFVRIEPKSFFVRNDFSCQAGEAHDLLVGVKYAYSDTGLNYDIKIDFPSQFDPDTDFTSAERIKGFENIYSNDYQVYVRDRWALGPAVTWMAGGRYTYEDYLNEHWWDPWLGSEVRLSHQILLTFGWGLYHQFPEGHEAVKEFGNPGIGSLKAEHVVTGLRYSSTEGGWTGQVEVYQKNFKDLTVEDPVNNYVNAGTGRAVGWEMLVKKDRVAHWSGWLSVSRSTSKRENHLTGQKIVFENDQPWIVNMVGTYWISQKFSIGVNARFHTGEPYTPVIGTYTDALGRVRPLYGEVGSERLPDYHRLDVRFNKDVFYNTFKLSFYIDLINVYARKNVSGYSYNADYTDKEAVSQLPFLPSFGIKAEF